MGEYRVISKFLGCTLLGASSFLYAHAFQTQPVKDSMVYLSQEFQNLTQEGELLITGIVYGADGETLPGASPERVYM